MRQLKVIWHSEDAVFQRLVNDFFSQYDGDIIKTTFVYDTEGYHLVYIEYNEDG